MFDRKPLFAELKNRLGSISADATDGIDAIVSRAATEGMQINKLAYVLATAWWETARSMQPVREAFFLGDFDKAENWRKKNLPYYPYYGRGYVQITHKANYKKASNKLGIDFVINPDLVMDKNNALEILFRGMKEGWFTGKKIDDFIDGDDEPDNEEFAEYVKARAIVNGKDKSETIADIAIVFENALRKAGYSDEAAVPASAHAAPAVVAAHASSDFTIYIESLGLNFFKPYEFLVKGSAHHNPSSPAFGLNTDPPAELWLNLQPVARVIDEFRRRVQRPVTISSAYRSPTYNKAIGGATNSRHTFFDALDFSVQGSPVGPLQWAAVLKEMRSTGFFKGGIGVYSSFVHVDTRGGNADWTG